MHYLLRKQIALLSLFSFLILTNVQAQKSDIYRSFHDDLDYYFGLTLGYNSSFLHSTKSTRFLQDDSVLIAEPGASGGIALGLLGTLRLSPRFQLSFNPQLIIGGARYFTYTLNNPTSNEDVSQKKTIPNTTFSFPLHFKFNSDRIENFRTYLLAGVKYDINVANYSSVQNAEGLLRLKKYDFGIEGGIGFNFFLEYFTLSPEIKFSYGLSNILDRQPNLKYSSVFEKLQTRMIAFSLHFED